MMSEHESGPTSDRHPPADPTISFPGDRPVDRGLRAVPVADGPRRAGAAVARAQALTARSLVAVATARNVLDGADAAPLHEVALHEVALREVAATHAALGDAVGALAARLRRDGAPPERMLVLVKDAARAATPPGADGPAARALMAHAVRRGIEAYYAA